MVNCLEQFTSKRSIEKNESRPNPIRPQSNFLTSFCVSVSVQHPYRRYTIGNLYRVREGESITVSNSGVTVVWFFLCSVGQQFPDGTEFRHSTWSILLGYFEFSEVYLGKFRFRFGTTEAQFRNRRQDTIQRRTVKKVFV